MSPYVRQISCTTIMLCCCCCCCCCCVELLGDVLKNTPRLDLSTDAIIVVDNVPKVNPDRLPKLENVLNKVFSKFGTILSHFHPKDENGTTKGWVGGCGQMGGAITHVMYVM